MNVSVLELLECAVDRWKNKIIYRDTDVNISFGEFDNLTKCVGTWLARNLVPGSPVSVLSGRSVLTPVCYLSVVRAGCFYAPMDASMPDVRLNQILDVMRSEVLLVDREHEETARRLDYDGKIVVIEDILETETDTALLKRACDGLTEASPLYVIFTSGSTGRPKGVITSHNSLMCYLDGLNDVINIDATDVLGNQSPLDYIASIRDIYLPILTGAETVIIPKSEFTMGGNVFKTLNRYGVTVICWSAAGLETVAKLGAFDDAVPKFLRCVVFSGSVLPGKYLKLWRDNLPHAMFVNQYGPTETTASCTYYVVRGAVTEETVLSIGKPYRHYGIVMLNDDNSETRRGEVGEICVTGPCLALGYYGDKEKTDESFIQNPLNNKYNELLYKTGDLGRIEEDGNISFLGRKDRQVKIMGHRIELDDIESMALQFDGVEECCSLFDSEKELLYLFYSGEAAGRDIVLYFRKNVPPFMAPRKVINLGELPRLPNGKRDMKAMKAMM